MVDDDNDGAAGTQIREKSIFASIGNARVEQGSMVGIDS
jgi:hypothetical protein